MAFQHSVTIGPEFFAKAKNDYRDWKFALAREFMQNCIDAPHSKRITIKVEHSGSNETLLTVSNDGAPMDRETLVNKLLCLGASGKDFVNTVGGFGKAKELLYMTHDRYDITTGNLHVAGSGAGYDLEVTDSNFNGTTSQVWIKGNLVEELLGQFKSFIFMTQWRGVVTINGVDLRCDFRKGSCRREFDWGVIYTNRSISNRMVVRIGGIPMFYRHVDCKNRCILVELKNGNANILQSNRDSLKWEFQSQLDSFIDEITVNKLSALRDTSPTYLHFNGDKLRSRDEARSSQIMQTIIQEAYATVPSGDYASDDDERTSTVAAPIGVDTVDLAPFVAASQKTATYEEAPVYKAQRKSKLNHEFVVKNTTGMAIPEHYLPHNFSEYSLKITKVWAKTLLALHELFGKQAEFSVGYIFDEDREAEYESKGHYGEVYYLNPITIVRQHNSLSRSFAKRWKLTSAGRYAILSDAVHEFVHGLGLSGHDEIYSSKLTETMGIVMANIKKFAPCFR